MTKKLKVTLNGVPLSVDTGISLETLLRDHPHPGNLPALGAIVNKSSKGLYYVLNTNSEIETIDLSHREGMDIYRRTASMILYAAVRRVYPQVKLTVGQSMSSTAYFFDVNGKEVDDQFVKEVSEEMMAIISDDLPVEVDWLSAEEAIELFESINADDKSRLINQMRNSEVPVAHLCDYVAIQHGPLASHTCLINTFFLEPYEHGLVLIFPDDSGNLTKGIPPQPKLFGVYRETKKWNELVKTRHIADLNDHCVNGGISDLIKVTEALHEKKIASISDYVAAKNGVKLLLVAGPSSSGKTTFTKRLSIQLKVHGIEPVAISLDDYYLPNYETPKNEDGTPNFETIDALDVPLLNRHLAALMNGEEVNVPIYHFNNGSRNPHETKPLRLKKDQILIMEGIHGLNRDLSKSVPDHAKYKIYVSALTQLCIDDHSRIFTTDTRLCRRIIRDRLFRGTNAAETIAMWSSVRNGEAKYIFPFQEDADVIFNSAFIYEHALLKPYAERYLMEVDHNHPSFMEASRLVRFFSYFIPILESEIPQNSLLREFIGKSSFKY